MARTVSKIRVKKIPKNPKTGFPLILATIKIYGRKEGPFMWVPPLVIPPDIPEDK